MNKIVIIGMVLLVTTIHSYANKIYWVSCQIRHNDKIIGKPRMVLENAKESSIEIKGKNGYLLSLLVIKKEHNILQVKTKFYLKENHSFELVFKPIFKVKNAQSTTIELTHPIFGNVELKLRVNQKQYS